MKEIEQNYKPIEKACPYWSRMAQNVDGFVMAYCSNDECHEQKKSGVIWEGPEKQSDCLLGYSPLDSILHPGVVICDPKVGLDKDTPRAYFDIVSVTDEVWEKLTEIFRNSHQWKEAYLGLAGVTKQLREKPNS